MYALHRSLYQRSRCPYSYSHTRVLRRCLVTTKPTSPEPSKSESVVRIVEVGPRDGLQNEKSIIPTEIKVELINKLAEAGMKTIEVGSFVSPKWVPQMAGTAEVLRLIARHPGVHFPVLIPNVRGLTDLLSLPHLSSEDAPNKPNTPSPLTDEIAVFTSASDAFSLSNTNTTVAQSLSNISSVISALHTHPSVQSSDPSLGPRIRVRGYISAVIQDPVSGSLVDPRAVRDVAEELLDMGCYEVSLGDTSGVGTPGSVRKMLERVISRVEVNKLAGHFHDTYGTALSNIYASLSLGLRVFDTSISGLGGCPYAPGATGNVATEDVVHALQAAGSKYAIEGNPNLEALVEIGEWISGMLGRVNASRAGRAVSARKSREKKKEAEKTK